MAKRIDQEHFRSTLPTYKVEKIQIFVNDERTRGSTALRITCPRKDCGKRFIISTKWPKTKALGTAPCPNCSKVSIIPGGKFRV